MKMRNKPILGCKGRPLQRKTGKKIIIHEIQDILLQKVLDK